MLSKLNFDYKIQNPIVTIKDRNKLSLCYKIFVQKKDPGNGVKNL